MDRHPVLHGIVEPNTVLRTLFWGLLGSLLLLADGYVLILVSRKLGIYLLLAGVASTGLIALVFIMAAYRNELDAMRRQIARGVYPQRHFRRLLPMLSGAALLVVPGLITDGLGLLLLIRPFGWLLGAFVERRHRSRFHELYEYLRLHD